MNQKLIENLQAKLIETLARIAPENNANYAILDFPNYNNIGDSAIYYGEEILLRRHFNRQPLFVTGASESDIDLVARMANRVDIIFLQGGGNFGDLWPRHQLFREAVVQRFPMKKIVQLPQTLFFGDAANLHRSADIINAHPDFTLMVRDRKSEEIARSAFRCPIELAPDMAFMIGAITPRRSQDCKVLGLIREDQESQFTDNSILQRLPKPHVILDWPLQPKNLRTFYDKVKGRIFKKLGVNRSPEAYRRLALSRVQRGVDILSRGEVVITDRLHAHILSLLLGKPHVIMDNSYGKISTFIDAWTQGGDFQTARTMDEAVDLTARLYEQRTERKGR